MKINPTNPCVLLKVFFTFRNKVNDHFVKYQPSKGQVCWSTTCLMFTYPLQIKAKFLQLVFFEQVPCVPFLLRLKSAVTGNL